MRSVLLSAELGNEVIAFLQGHVMLAQLQFSNDESMQYACFQALACVSGFSLLHDAVLHDGAPVVPTVALELQADIVCILYNSLGKLSNWWDTLFKSFLWPTAKPDIREYALGVSADVGK